MIKILIIEDEEIVKETLAENLKEKGFIVDGAENAAIALSLIKQNRYDILLVDYRLPDMNGLSLIKEASLISKDSISIVVTGYSAVEKAVDSMRMGAYDYLLKPVDIDSLVSEIKEIMLERDLFMRGKDKVRGGIAGSLKIAEEDVVVLASRDSLVPSGKESIIKKIFLLPWLLFRKIIDFYWA
ncbi:MAG: response regulator [Endomicrobium sp.]|nr:response regulator [Endomicrobium sp.]